MSRYNFIKTTFNAGEFSPSIYGRTDLEKYNNGCITMKNFIPIPQGGATRRPGFEYIADAKNHGDKVRLIPFQFSDEQSYIIECGADYNRYYKDGGQIITPDSYTKLLLHMNGADASTTFTNDGAGFIRATTIAFVDSNPDTITDSGNGFVTANMAVGSITVAGSTNNDGTYEVTGVAAGTLTLAAGESLTAEAAGDNVTITMHPVTANGDVQVDTDQKKFGTGSAMFDGTGDYLSIPDSADLNYGSSEVTIETWFRLTSVDGTMVVYNQYADASNFAKIWIYNHKIFVYIKSAGAVIANYSKSYTFSASTQYHFALIRGWGSVTNTWAITINGSLVGTTETITGTWPDIGAALKIGEMDWDKEADPSSLPTGIGRGTALNNDDSLMAVAHNTSPYITIYNTSDWSKVTNPSTLPTGIGYDVAFNSDGSLMAVAHHTSPYVTIYNTSDWSKVTNPSSLPAGNAEGVAFNNDGSLMAVAHYTSPYVTIYNTSDWSKVADPSSLPTGTCFGVAFNNDGTLMAVSHDTSPYVTIYNTSDWSKVANPSTLPTGVGRSVAFNNDGTLMAVGHQASPYITIYNTSGWSKVTDPSTLPAGSGYGVSFSDNDSLMAVAHESSPCITIYNTSDWSKITNPSTLPTTRSYGVSFGGSLTAVTDYASPYVIIYLIGMASKGHKDEYRVSKGVARWTENFTPPTREYPLSTDDGDIYESSSTGILESELDTLKWAQSYDTMYIVHKDQAPMKLTRADHNDWSLSDVSFTDTPSDWGGDNGYPRAVTFHQDRLVLAGSPGFPPRFWFSKTSDYEVMTTGTGDDDGFTITLLSGSVDMIYWLESQRRLVAGSNSGEWWLSGDGNDLIIVPTSKQAQNDTKHGSIEVQPINIGNTLLLAQAPGTKVREMSYNYDTDSYASNDITILADHILKGYSLKQMAYQQTPYQIVWVLRSDGTLFALTYMKEHQVVGWSEIETDGTVISIATIPGNPEDELWLAVERVIDGSTKTYIERMKDFEFDTLQDVFMVDSGLTYDGAATTTISGLDHLEGETVDVLADGVVGSYTVSSGSITLSSAASLVHIGMPYNSDLQTMYVDIPLETGSSMFIKKRIPTVHFRLRDSAGGKYGKDTSSLVSLQSSTPLYSGDLVNKSVNMGWTRNASIYIRQDEPLPLTIDTMVMEVEVGG